MCRQIRVWQSLNIERRAQISRTVTLFFDRELQRTVYDQELSPSVALSHLTRFEGILTTIEL